MWDVRDGLERHQQVSRRSQHIPPYALLCHPHKHGRRRPHRLYSPRHSLRGRSRLTPTWNTDWLDFYQKPATAGSWWISWKAVDCPIGDVGIQWQLQSDSSYYFQVRTFSVGAKASLLTRSPSGDPSLCTHRHSQDVHSCHSSRRGQQYLGGDDSPIQRFGLQLRGA